MSDELPKGWASTALTNVGMLQNGPFGSLLHRTDYVKGGVPLINPTNILGGRLVEDPDITVGPEIVDRLSAYVMRPGDVVVGRRGEMGRAALVTPERDRWFCGTGCAFVRPSQAITGNFLSHWFSSPAVRSCLENAAVGATMSNLSTRILGSLEIALPPLAEQHRIVEMVEALLEQVNRVKVRLGRVPLILKRFRQAVLAAACSGELTREWRESRLSLTRTEARSVPLREVITHLDQGWSPKCMNHPASSAQSWAVIKTTAVQPMAFLDVENKELPKDLQPRPELELKVGDLLITRAGPRVRAGVCCLVRATRGRLMICDKVYRFRVDTNRLLPAFAEVVLNEPAKLTEIDALKTGISDSGVNLTQGKFLDLEVPLPEIEEQREIVRQVERLFTLADTVERRLQAATSRAENIPQAILSKAFSGELVPTEVELARAEGRTYETAEELLQRVNAARGDASGSSKPRGRPPRGEKASTVRG